MSNGTVKWFSTSKGFGYVTDDSTRAEVFAHYSEIKTAGPKVLREKQRVKYEIKTGGPTGSRATNIEII